MPMQRDKTQMQLDIVHPLPDYIVAKAQERLKDLAPDDHEHLAMILDIAS